MKKLEAKLKNFTLMIGMVAIVTCFVASAWAAVSLIGTNNPVEVNPGISQADLQIQDAEKPKSRAPEPTTLALFGSGFLGMIISFVRKTYATAKRFLDIVASLVGFVVLSPLFLITAILVKLTSKGPIIYAQERCGKDGVPFKIYKFRTMKVDAEKETGPVWAAKNDNRLTSIGSFLRKAHIDEIPQLFNVLKGEMSIVGPRPERPVFVGKFSQEIHQYESRLLVKPGITGLAQVWHRYDETMEDVKKKLKYDLLYIKKMCLWTDVRILLRTFRVVATGEGAR